MILSFFSFAGCVWCGAACGVLAVLTSDIFSPSITRPAQPSPAQPRHHYQDTCMMAAAQPSPAIDHHPAAVFLIWAHECRHARPSALQHCSHPNGINQHPAAAASIQHLQCGHLGGGHWDTGALHSHDHRIHIQLSGRRAPPAGRAALRRQQSGNHSIQSTYHSLHHCVCTLEIILFRPSHTKEAVTPPNGQLNCIL